MADETIAARYISNPHTVWDGTEIIPVDVAGVGKAGLLSGFARQKLSYSAANLHFYCRTTPVVVTFTTGSPGTVNWTAHNLSVNDPVVFALPRDKGVVTVTIASPGVFTKTAHGLSNNDPVMLSTTGALPTGFAAVMGGYSGGTTLYVRAAAANTFELSLTFGGVSINSSGTQSGVHRVMRNSSMPVGLTNGTIYYVQSVPNANSFTIAATEGGAAINLTGANAVGRVWAQTGNDDNDGSANDAAHAWLTADKVKEYINNDGVRGTVQWGVKFHFAEGDYSISNDQWWTFSAIRYVWLIADSSANFNGNCVLFGTYPFFVSGYGFLYVQGFTVIAQGFSACFYVERFSHVETSLCELYSGQFCYAYTYRFGLFENFNDLWLTHDGGLNFAFGAEIGAELYVGNSGNKLYLEVTPSVPAFSDQFAYAGLLGGLYFAQNTAIEGSATGKRFEVELGGILYQANSTSLNFLPGSVAGTAAGGSYVIGTDKNVLLGDITISTYAARPAVPFEGMRAIITDSTVNTWGATIAGGGAMRVEGRYNGTNWLVSAL